MRGRLLVLLLLAGSACASPQPRPGPRPQPRSVAPRATEPIADAPEPPRPAWMEPPLPGQGWSDAATADLAKWLRPERRPPRFGNPKVLAAAHRMAVVETDHGQFVVHAKAGVTGPHALGDFVDVVITADDSFFVARENGALLRARRLASGEWSAPEQVAKVPGARGWVAGATVIAAHEGEALHVSTDAGASFTTVVPRKGERIHAVWARRDDVLVVETDHGHTLVSTDRAKTFARTVNVNGLAQLGGWIYGVDHSCSMTIWTALARDGRTWVRVPNEPANPAQRRADDLAPLFVSSAELQANPQRPAPWADDVESPAASLPKYAGFPVCALHRVGSGRKTKTVRMLDVGYEIAPWPECHGVDCVRGQRAPERPATKTRAYLLHDALCTGATECTQPLKLLRPPHALFVEDSSTVPDAIRGVRTVSLPSECAIPRFVTFSSGLVLLACVASPTTTRVFTATSEGVWSAEATLAIDAAIRPGDFEMTADGTAMLASYDGEPRAWVREPVALGVEAAWREVTRPRAVAYRLRDGGRVDVVLAEPEIGDDVLTLIEDAPGAPPRSVLAKIAVGGDLWCIGRKGPAIVGLRRKPNGGFERIVLTEAGVVIDGTVLDGSGRIDPTGACGHGRARRLLGG